MEGCFGCLHAAVVLPGAIIMAIDAIHKWWKRRKERHSAAANHSGTPQA